MRLSVLLCLIVLLLSLGACRQETPDSSEAGKTSLGRVHGTVVSPLEGSYLYVYKKGMDLYGPAYAVSEATGPDGGFSLALPPGDYTIVARRRENGETVGPVVAGDQKSDFIQLSVSGDGDRELSIVAPTKVGDSRRLTKQAEVTKTGLTGRITDADGNPVKGARVHVYDHVQMSERPKYVSEKTGPDGRYMLYLPEGGTYYLAARDKFGGPPKLGDLYGRYDKGTIEPSAVVVRDGEMLKKIDITLTKVW